MSWKKLLESVSESLHDHLQLRHDYLLAENRILRNQIAGRVQLTASERKELAELGTKLGKKALAAIATAARPDTILAWNRKFVDPQVDISEPSKSVGRPRVDQEIEDLVLRMARENRSWGYDRIQGALKHLGYMISDQTVGNILKRHGMSPAPARKKTMTWQEFVRIHLDVLLATDFFNSEVWSWCKLLISYLLSFIHIGYHQGHAVLITLHQQILGLRPHISRSFDLLAHVSRWVHMLEEPSRAIRLGKRVVQRSLSEVILADVCKPSSQDTSKVVVLSAARLRQIRDGPGQRGQQLDGQRPDSQREVA
jgi:transposase